MTTNMAIPPHVEQPVMMVLCAEGNRWKETKGVGSTKAKELVVPSIFESK